MKILVTGSEGNIGKPLCDYLKTQGREVFGVDLLPGFSDTYEMCNVNNIGEIMEVFDAFNPTHVIHLAAVYGRLANEKFYHNSIETNLIGLANVIHLCKKNKCKLLFTSSSEVYGDVEEEMIESRPLTPNNRYGMLKKMGEEMIQYEVKEYGLDAVIARPNMLISPLEQSGIYRSAMIRFVTSLLNNEPVTVYEGSSRSWLAISDAVVLLERMLLNVSSGEVVNIAHPRQVDTIKVAEYICWVLGLDPKRYIIKEPLPVRMTLVKPVSTSKMIDMLRYVPKVTWQEIADQVIENVRNR